MTRVLGIDPGYAKCGLAVLASAAQRWEPLLLETVSTSPLQPFDTRLHVVWSRVQRILGSDELRPDVMAIEAQARAQAGYRERLQSSDNAVAVREVVGLLRALAWQHGLLMVEVEPSSWRQCLGLKRTAKKAQVQRAVVGRLGQAVADIDEHAADAVGIALGGERLARNLASIALSGSQPARQRPEKWRSRRRRR